MNHPKNDQPDLPASGCRPTARAIAMTLPEILSNVLTFLDRPTLIACLRVSCLWYTCSWPILWRTLSLPINRFMSLVYGSLHGNIKKNDTYAREKNNKENKYTDRFMAKDFFENCHQIRSLTLLQPDGEEWIELVKNVTLKICPETPIKFDPRVAGLRNLDHFSFRSVYHEGNRFSEFSETDEWTCFLTMGAVISQNPEIQELEWGTDSFGFGGIKSLEAVMDPLGHRLKKLSIDNPDMEQNMGIVELVIKENEKRRRRQFQQNESQQIGQATKYQPSMDGSALEGGRGRKEDDSGDDGGNGRGGYELQELVLKDTEGVQSGRPSYLNFSGLHRLQGHLPIRALTFINMETGQSFNTPRWFQKYDCSIFPFLSKCPLLEKLCVSFDLHPHHSDDCLDSFLENLCEDLHFDHTADVGQCPVLWEHDKFVQEMYECCPKLREIELGMFYQLTDHHWIEMMEKYGQQLESLSVWGNVFSYDSRAFMTLIGSPMSCSSKDRLHNLTRLNINGMKHLHDCAWMAFYHLPHLKEFRARDVPLDGRSLINEDGWVCKGLELLEILVLIPVLPRQTQLSWRNIEGRWVNECTNTIPKDTMAFKEDKNDDDQGGENNGLRRRLEEEDAAEESRKRAIISHYNHLQVMVCEMLGRLTQLRELRIEGSQVRGFNSITWTCLELTLETGLDRLTPLRQNLEKFVVTLLDEGLSGRKEVEWIARNWIHYNNNRWLEQHDASVTESSSQAMDGSVKSGSTDTGSNGDDPFVPLPKLKQLIGISVPPAKTANVEWLQEQCPTLFIGAC